MGKQFREAAAVAEAELQAELDAENAACVVVPPAEAQEPNKSEEEEAAVVGDVVEGKAASTEGDKADVVKEADAMVEEGTSEPIEEADDAEEQNENATSKTAGSVDVDVAAGQEEAPEREAAQNNDDA